MRVTKIRSIKSIGIKIAMDLTVGNKNHNFIADGVVVSNSHSVSYAILSAITSFLKINYPQEFFISLLKMSQYEPKPHEQIRAIAPELKHFGINLLPPDLALSGMDFTIEGDNIRYGLSSIKGISSKTLEALTKFRSATKPNKYDIFIAAKEAGLNIGALSALIQAGTLTGYKQKRSRLVLEAQCWNILTDREKRNLYVLGPKYEYDLLLCIRESSDNKLLADDQKPIFKDSRFETIKGKLEKYKAIYAQNSKFEDFANWYFEKKLLGYSPELRLKKIMGPEFKDSEDIPDLQPRSKYKFIGTVELAKKSKSANGNIYILLNMFDDSGTFKVLMCDNARFKKCSEYLEEGGKIPEKEDIVVVLGSKSEDGTVFADDISIMSEKIYMKLSDVD